MLSVGIDVAEEGKGLDVVALDSDRRVVFSQGGLTVAQAAETVLEEVRPDIVCIDSPSGWSRSGRSRRAERELARQGISAFATGPDPGDHPFYRWMRVGHRLFAALAERYPLFRGEHPAGRAAEVFPHATAVVLAGRARVPGETKLRFRRQVLTEHRVDAALLPGIDRVDAALAALTGVVALSVGWTCVGDPDEGVVLLPPRAERSLAPPPPVDTALSPRAVLDHRARPRPPVPVAGVCGCGCGAPVRRRFLPGHDAKLKSRLLRGWGNGDEAAGRRLQELGWR